MEDRPDVDVVVSYQPPQSILDFQIHRPEGLTELLRLMKEMARREAPSEVALRHQPGIILDHVSDVVLRAVSPLERTPPLVRVRKSKGSGEVHISWSGDSDDWENAYLLMVSLKDGARQDFQYLTGYESLESVNLTASIHF